MSSAFSHRGLYAGATIRSALALVTVLVICAMLTGCGIQTQTDGQSSGQTAVAQQKVTTTWQPPSDPDAQGPTEAPVLPEVKGDLDEEIDLPTAMSVSLGKITSTTIKAQTPGEYDGPAVVVKVILKNGSQEAQNVASAVVVLTADGNEIGIPTWSEPSAPLDGEVAPGGTIEGTYVFMLDPVHGRTVSVSVNYAAGEPVAMFSGKTK